MKIVHALLIALPFSLPSLARADATRPFCNPQAAQAAAAPVIMDFDGDGASEVVTARRTNTKTTFRIFSLATGATREVEMTAGQPVPGDYDGDGKWDPATARSDGRSIVWEWVASSTGNVVTKKFGGAQDTVVSGCRFLPSGQQSLSYVRNRRLFASDPQGASSLRASFKNLATQDLLGCGDPTGDGNDEPIFRAVGTKKSSDALVTPSCKDEVIVYRNIRPFDDALIAPRPAPDFPLVISLRDKGESRTQVDVQALAEVFQLPKFTVARSGKFSFGIFNYESGPVLTLLWESPSEKAIRRLALISGNATSGVVTTLDDGFRLVRPQFVGAVK